MRLINLLTSEDSYTTSPLISDPSKDTPPPPTYRTSTSCTLPNEDPDILTLTLRVYNILNTLDIQADGIERFQAVRYPSHPSTTISITIGLTLLSSIRKTSSTTALRVSSYIWKRTVRSHEELISHADPWLKMCLMKRIGVGRGLAGI